MALAREEAEKAFQEDEVPVGAIIVRDDGKIISRARNRKEATRDASDHAEMIALKAASKELGDWRLTNCHLLVTLEPCLMCMGAMSQFRIGSLFFGAYDPKGGAISIGQKSFKNPALNHQFKVVGGIQHYQCSKMLSEFFKTKRSKYNYKN